MPPARDGETLSDERIAQLQSEFAGLSMLRGDDFDDHDFSELFLDAAHVCELVAALRAELAELKGARENTRRVWLGRHTRLSEALSMDPGYSADATIDEAIKMAVECVALRARQETDGNG